MKKIIKIISTLIFLLVVLILPYFVFAANDVVNNLQNVGQLGGFNPETNETSISAIAGTIVAALLSLLGVIFIGLLIYGGITWMMAEGDEQKVEKAQKIMRNAIIGLIITVSVFAIYSVLRPIIYGADVG
ncbi:MAG TPA: hypothetical protein VMD74_01930 [Candidatus Methylomirabilis sp.]|nr:hypothetical protein [Candidatus Methylomirabilis sp.]